MITNFKIFETLNMQPEIGDYVIIDTSSDFKFVSPIIRNHITSSIGKLIIIDKDINDKYIIEYILPEDLYMTYFPRNKNKYHDVTYRFVLKDIKYWSKDKEDLEEILAAKKYNL